MFAESASLPVKVCINNACILAEVASSQDKREQGLMFRQNLPDNQGMLFIFDTQDRHYFWMKNMNFTLDIIWVDSNKKIVDIKEKVPVCKDERCESFSPRFPARYVLEAASGFCQKNKIKVGQEASF